MYVEKQPKDLRVLIRVHMCESPKHLGDLFGKLIKNPYISERCPYGDGATSESVLEILRNEKL